MSRGRIVVIDRNDRRIDEYICPRDDCSSLACSEVGCNYFHDMSDYYKQHIVEWEFDDD